MRDGISSRIRRLPAGMSGGRAPNFALAVYGGAFGPPHPGHESAIRRALLHAERVTLVPSHRHAFDKCMDSSKLHCRWLTRLARWIDPRQVYCEPIEAELIPDRPAAYSTDLLEALAVRNGLASARIALLIGVDNEAEPPRSERATELCWRFDRLVAEGWLPLHSSVIRQHLRERLVIPGTWCLPKMKGEPHCRNGERQAAWREK